MVTKEKLAWIRHHLRKGDRKAINQMVEHVKYKTLCDIITGDMFGSDGQAVIDAAEKFVRKRLRAESRERRKFMNIPGQ